MNATELFKVNGEVLPSPVSAVWSIADLSSDESGRSSRTGAMSKDIIAQKRTLTFTWGILSFEEAARTAQLCKNKGAAVWLSYPDVMQGVPVTRRFYTGDMTGGSLVVTNGELFVNGLTCSFIEM